MYILNSVSENVKFLALNIIGLGYIRSLQALTVHFWEVMYVL